MDRCEELAEKLVEKAVQWLEENRILPEKTIKNMVEYESSWERCDTNTLYRMVRDKLESLQDAGKIEVVYDMNGEPVLYRYKG